MMHIQGILDFLKQLAVNNNREWFQAHKDTYLSVQKDFEDLLALVIARISFIRRFCGSRTAARLYLSDL